MMAEAIDWDDSATVSGQPVPADEAWHVAVAPDDVKVVSLEQLDDMFRLSLVDSETKVWQPGMSEWVSLGVIAGLEQAPPPPPKRSHPKPPSPRSAPPPPQRAAAAPFYAEPLAPASYAPTLSPARYALPPVPSMAPIASVRPLVVSHNPYPMPRGGGGFGRFIVWLSLLAGIGVTLYRNDVLRTAAHAVHQDGLYAQLEQRLGGPAFGTLRAVEQSADGQAAAALKLGGVTGDATPAQATSPRAALASTERTPTPPLPETAAPSKGSSPPVVSLESLSTEKKAGANAQPEAALAAPVTKAAPSFVSAPVAKAAPVAVAKAPEPKAAPAPKAAPVEKPAPPPVATKPESEMTPRERLNAEIARSMTTSPASKKNSKSSTGLKGSGEYDPLNPKL
jgi:GYF domain 2